MKLLERELERKKAELKKETNFYQDLRDKPRKSPGEWRALDMSQISRKSLQKEIAEMEEKLQS